MKPIRILSPSVDILAEIDNYESLIFTRSWHGVGSFELRVNRYKQHADTLQKQNLVMLSRNKVGIIKHREIELDENGKATENWLIRGVTLKGVMKQRLTEPPSNVGYDNRSSNAETVMKHYVSRNVVNPEKIARIIELVEIANNQNRGISVSWQTRYKELAEELELISLYSGLGWDVTIDFATKKYIFDVSEGRDLTVNQSVNPPVIFSPEFESVRTQKFTDSDLNFRNVGYVAGQGEGAEREVVLLGDATGLDRHETFIDARDVEETSMLIQRGQQKLKEFETETYLESEILTHGTFVYEKDFDLGDFVTVQNRGWGYTRNARITEVVEVYEPNGMKLTATFGNSRPTLISKLKQKFAEFEIEVKR
ncbi:siphovirus ReqiPepy6 Gp37-like family protein [Sutcliffiella cohnii]|uniref:siphovirus ReqiPepy6 Gp37-like family protein n=1 Tax=Sutcliffiella cohnii TaxID=33932 RepID=UPI002E1C94DC|nr:siphovirus ReqiPepy6 Gp37-like family protein [Sutcliffiella cohnii]